MVHFLPFAVELSEKGPFEIIGNKYSAEVCALAGLKNVTHDPSHNIMAPPPGATVARIQRYGNASLWWARIAEMQKIVSEFDVTEWPEASETMRKAAQMLSFRAQYEAAHPKTYRQIYAEATGCTGNLWPVWRALGIFPTENLATRSLLFDTPRPSGLGSKLYTPDLAEFARELTKIEAEFSLIVPLLQQPDLRSLFATVAGVSAGFGQIGFLTALCQLFDKPFYPVRGSGEADERFLARCRVVHL